MDKSNSAMSSIKQISDHSYALHLNDGRVFTLSNHRGSELDSLVWHTQTRNWEYMPCSVGGYQVIPYGFDNLLPSRLRRVVDDNNLAPGIIDRQMGLLYGQGVFLNQLVFENGEISHKWTEDREIQSWLDDWDYLSYIKGVMTDYLYLKGFLMPNTLPGAIGSAGPRKLPGWNTSQRKMPGLNGRILGISPT